MTSLDDINAITPSHIRLQREDDAWRSYYRGFQEQQPAEPWSLLDYLGDVGAAPFRGAEGFVRSVADLLTGFQLDLSEGDRLFGRSETVVGGLGEGITQFMLGFVPIAGWIGRGAHLGRAGQAVGMSRAPILSQLSNAAIHHSGRRVTGKLTQSAVAGMLTDFAVWDGHEARLANLVESFPSLQNPVTEFLQADPDDPEIVGRLKGVFEGLPLGILADGLIHVLGKLRESRKLRAMGRDLGMTEDQIAEQAEALSKLKSTLETDKIRGPEQPVKVEPEPAPPDPWRKVPAPETTPRGTPGEVGEEAGDQALEDFVEKANLDALKAIDAKIAEIAPKTDRYARGDADVAGTLYRMIGMPPPGGDDIVRIGMMRMAKSPVEALLGQEAEKRLTEALLKNEAVARDVDPEGLLGPNSPLTKAGKEKLVQKHRARAQEILTEMNDLLSSLKTEDDAAAEFHGGQMWETMTDAGETLRIKTADVGKAKPRWVDADTGLEIRDGDGKLVTNEVQAKAAMLGQMPPKMEMPKGGLVELEHLGRAVKARLEGHKSLTFPDGTTKDLPTSNVNPRNLSAEELVEGQIRCWGMNLARMDAEPADVVRAFEATYEEVLPLLAKTPEENAEALARSMGDLKDLLGMGHSEPSPRAILELEQAGLETVAAADKVRSRTLAWRSYLNLQAEEFMARSTEFTEAGDARKLELLPELALLRDRFLVSYRVARDLGTQAGRTLQVHKIPFGSYKSLAEALQLSGGARDVAETAQSVAAMARDTGGNHAKVADVMRASQAGPSQMTVEWWINSLLGSGKTQIINFLSNSMMAVLRPFEHMLGAAFMGDKNGAMAAATEFLDLIEVPFRMFQVDSWSNKALRAANQAFLSGDPQLTTGHKFLDHGGPAITTGNLRTAGGRLGRKVIPLPDSPMGRAADWIFENLVRLPTKALGFTDEFSKQVNYHLHAKSLFTRDGLKQGKGYIQARLDAEEQVSKLTYQYMGYSRQMLEKKHMDQIMASPTERAVFATTDQAKAEAKKRALKDWDSSDGLLARLIGEDAMRVSEEATFTQAIDPNGTQLERTTAKMQAFLNSHFILKFFAPFIRTPFNILRWATDRSVDPMWSLFVGAFKGQNGMAIASKPWAAGLSMVKTQQIKSRFMRDLLGDIDLPRDVAPDSAQAKLILESKRQEAVGKIATAVGITGLFTTLAAQGLITGKGPEDKEQRRALESAGWMPYSIRTPGGYVSYARLDPVATLVGVIADMVDIGRYSPVDDEKPLQEFGFGVVTSVLNNVTNKTYLTGLKRFVDAISEPGHASARAIRDIAGAMAIPGLARDVTTLLAPSGADDQLREVRSVADALLARLPYSKNLDPIRNFMGEPVRRMMSFGYDEVGRIAALTVPLAYTELSHDRLAEEIAGLRHGFSPPRASQGGVDLRDHRNEKGQSAYDRMMELRGQIKVGGKTIRQALLEVVRSPGYQMMPAQSSVDVDSPRIAEIQNVVQRYHQIAMRQMLREFPQVHAQSQEIRRTREMARYGLLRSLD